MSVDPVIQSPTNTQSINPYSYIMNNPMSGTDPSGYTSIQKEPEKFEVTGSRIKRSRDAKASRINSSSDNVKFNGFAQNSESNNGAQGNSQSAPAAKPESKPDIGGEINKQKQQEAPDFVQSALDETLSGDAIESAFNDLNTQEGFENPDSDNGIGSSDGKMGRSFWDNLGARLPSAPQSLVDFVAGFGDSLSFNLTKHIRGWADIGSVDTDSDNYGYGNTTGTVFGLANAGRAGFQVYKSVNKAKKWRVNSKTSRKTRARKIAAAGTYRPSAADATLTLIGGSGVDSYISLMADED